MNSTSAGVEAVALMTVVWEPHVEMSPTTGAVFGNVVAERVKKPKSISRRSWNCHTGLWQMSRGTFLIISPSNESFVS